MDLTLGNPVSVILLYSIPILIGNLFQQFYNVVDTVMVGHILGDNALAAVGATTSAYGLFMGLAYGFTNGSSIIIARCYGEKNIGKLKRAVYNTILVGIGTTILFTLLGVICIGPILKLLGTPDVIYKQSMSYIMIIMGFMVLTFLYNFTSALLRGIGNSKVPLYSLVIASLVNIILDYVFIAELGWGVAGAAAATVIAQGIAGMTTLLYILKKCPLLVPAKENCIADKEMLKDIITMGSSMGLMFSIVSMGSVILQSGVNGLGTAIITAHTTARRIDEMLMQPLMTIGMATATFVSQNYGAKQLGRVKQGIKGAFFLGVVWSVAATTIVYLLGGYIVDWISGTSNQDIINTAERYLQINVPFFPVLCILLILRNSLQGLGRKIVPVMASCIEMLGKVVITFVFVGSLGYLAISFCEPIVWILCALMVLWDYVRLRRESTFL